MFEQDPTQAQRQIATRIKQLPKGSVTFQNVLPQRFKGVVDRLPDNLVSLKWLFFFIYLIPLKTKGEPDRYQLVFILGRACLVLKEHVALDRSSWSF